MMPFEDLPAVKAFRKAAAGPTPPAHCERCGEEMEDSPNVEAFELSGQVVCDDCAEEIFEDNSQFGVGA